jgi:hypothetical protein
VDLIGLEPSAANPEKQAESAIDPSSVVTPVVTLPTDCPDLAALVELWRRLSPAMRSAVRAMAEAAFDRG